MGRLRRFFEEDLWFTETFRLSWLKRSFYNLCRFFMMIARGIFHRRTDLNASMLTYRTIFAIIPLLVVTAFTLRNVVPQEQLNEVITQIVGFVNPTGDQGVVSKINQTLGNILSEKVGAVSIVFLLITLWSLISGVERALNQIWGVQGHQGLVWRFIVYWAVLTLGSMMLAASLSLLIDFQGGEGWLGVLLQDYLRPAAPYLGTWVVFSLIYAFVPNTRVKLGAAAVGGMVGGSLFLLIQAGFYLLVRSPGWLLYGALATPLLVLFGLYLAWLAFLFGAEVGYAVQSTETFRLERKFRHLSVAQQEYLTVLLAVEVARAFLKGTPAPTAAGLAKGLHLPLRLVNLILGGLAERRLVSELQAPDREVAYQPGRSPREIVVRDLLDTVRHRERADLSDSFSPGVNFLAEIFSRAEQARDEVCRGLNLEELVNRLPAAEILG